MARTVDVNVHLISADRARFPVAPASGTLPAWASGSAEDFLEHMRVAGVDQAAVVHTAGVYGYDNSYSVDCAQRYPGSFTTIAGMDVSAPDAGDTFVRLASLPGVGGIRFELRDEESDPAQWLDAPGTIPLWQEAANRGIPVSLPSVRKTSQLPAVRRVLERFPTVPVVLRRFLSVSAEDGPPYRAASDVLALGQFPNVYFTFSIHNIQDAKKGQSTPEAFFDACMSSFGARRLMWGSYFPANRGTPDSPYKSVIDQVREELSFLGQDDRDWLLGETARSLFAPLRAASA